MPQLAPLSWVFLSFFLFLVLFGLYGGVWWMVKLPLSAEGKVKLVSGYNFWKW